MIYCCLRFPISRLQVDAPPPLPSPPPGGECINPAVFSTLAPSTGTQWEIFTQTEDGTNYFDPYAVLVSVF